MPTNILISFLSPSTVYFSGQTIAGTLRITCTSEKRCREITVSFKGFSKVHWTERKTERRDGKTHTRTVHYRSSEEYYSTKYRVWGDGNENVLPPGTHNFNFSFQLPHNIPSSFESEIGQVRHICEAKMDIPWGFDKKSTLPYSVNCLYDLNTDPAAKLPIECNQHKNLCCFCCKSGPLSMVLRVSRSGYVPGENITINAECSNKTNSTVEYSEANIHQVITFYANGKRKQIDRKVAEIKRGLINPGDDDIWSNVRLLVPALPPTRLQHCHNIDIAYTFKFKVCPSGCHTNLDHKVNLVIGSIPLRESFPSFAPSAVHVPQPPSFPPQPSPMQPLPQPGRMPSAPYGGPTHPGQPTAPGWGLDANSSPFNPNYQPAPPEQPSAPVFPGLQHYPDMPPPTYNECMFGPSRVEDDEDEDGGGGSFAPRYASYNLAHTPSVAPPPYDPSMAPPPYMAQPGAESSAPLIT